MGSKPDMGSKPSQPSPEVKDSEPVEKPDMGSKPTPPKTRKPKYNPYGENATATPENMAPGKP